MHVSSCMCACIYISSRPIRSTIFATGPSCYLPPLKNFEVERERMGPVVVRSWLKCNAHSVMRTALSNNRLPCCCLLAVTRSVRKSITASAHGVGQVSLLPTLLSSKAGRRNDAVE